jgi:Tfp pilus assembly protein PilF
VGIHRSATEAPLLFFAMELLHGRTLADRIGRGRLTREEAFPIAVQLAEGLEAAHRAGIVHADFKSANVILVESPGGVRAVITDFGLARIESSSPVVDDTRPVQNTIRVAGTLAYMSPEQLAGDRVTAASDIYSFGIVLFEMACGRRPFDDADIVKTAMLRVSGPSVSARKYVATLDDRWDTAIARCLQRDADRRFHSAGELANWFRDGRWWDVRHWTPLDRVRASIVAVLVALAATGVWSWTHRPYQPLPEAQRVYERGVNALYSMTYETARKALEQSVAIDPTFALAHASLARAYDELDYTERAKDSMLRAVAAAQDSRLSEADDRKLRALQFMVSRDYARAAPLVQQIEADARAEDRAAAALEAGWLAQQMEETDAAAAAFGRALALDSSYAAAKLRLGFLFGRQGGKDEQALAAFSEAEGLYRAAGNIEGVTQTLLERANLFDRRNREKEALPVVADALTMARAVGNRYQEIRLRFIEAAALRDIGETERAATLVREAIESALAENMDNLGANGQIDLGNIFLRADDFASAEPVFRRALDIARRAKVRRIEARAEVSLGSLFEQTNRPGEAKPLVEAALTFYRDARYERESVQAATILGGLHQQLGDSQEGVRVLTEALPQAIRLQDRRLEAQVRERLADCLVDRGDFPRALSEFERASQLFGPTASGEAARQNAQRLRAKMATSPQN